MTVCYKLSCAVQQNMIVPVASCFVKRSYTCFAKAWQDLKPAMWALSPVEAVQGEAALLVVNVSTVDPAVHGQHPDVLGCHPLTGPGLGAGLLRGLGAQLEGRQPQHCIIGHLVRLLCKQDTHHVGSELL